MQRHRGVSGGVHSGHESTRLDRNKIETGVPSRRDHPPTGMAAVQDSTLPAAFDALAALVDERAAAGAGGVRPSTLWVRALAMMNSWQRPTQRPDEHLKNPPYRPIQRLPKEIS